MPIRFTSAISNQIDFVLKEKNSSSSNVERGRLDNEIILTNDTTSLNLISNAQYGEYGILITGVLSSGGKEYLDMKEISKNSLSINKNVYFTKIKALLLENRSQDYGADLSIAATGVRSFTELFNGGSGNLVVKPYGAYLYSDVTDGVKVLANHRYLFLNDLGGSGAEYSIIFLGNTGLDTDFISDAFKYATGWFSFGITDGSGHIEDGYPDLGTGGDGFDWSNYNTTNSTISYAKPTYSDGINHNQSYIHVSGICNTQDAILGVAFKQSHNNTWVGFAADFSNNSGYLHNISEDFSTINIINSGSTTLGTSVNIYGSYSPNVNGIFRGKIGDITLGIITGVENLFINDCCVYSIASGASGNSIAFDNFWISTGAPSGFPVDSFSPLELSPTAWYDASDYTYVITSGASIYITGWLDKSNNGYHLINRSSVTDNKPTTLNTSYNINGNRRIAFANDWLTLTGTGFSTSLTIPFTFVLASEHHVTAVLQQNIIDGTGSTNRATLYKTQSTDYYEMFATTNLGNTTRVYDGFFYITFAEFNGANSNIIMYSGIGGGNLSSPVSGVGDPGTTVLDSLTVGNRWDKLRPAVIRPGEILILDRSLNANERIQLLSYLQNKWIE